MHGSSFQLCTISVDKSKNKIKFKFKKIFKVNLRPFLLNRCEKKMKLNKANYKRKPAAFSLYKDESGAKTRCHLVMLHSQTLVLNFVIFLFYSSK